MGFSVGPVQGGMMPQAFGMGVEQNPLNWEDFETEEEYMAALKRRKMEDQEFFTGGMSPNARFMGSSGYAPRAWGEPKEKPKT